VEGIRKLDELVSTNAESVASDVHTVALALLVEVKITKYETYSLSKDQFIIDLFIFLTGKEFAIPSVQGCHPINGQFIPVLRPLFRPGII